MFDLWAPENSTLREKALEHIFLSELSKVLLLDLQVPFEVLRSEFDASGYDVVIEALGVIRHVQLKATRVGGKRSSIDVNLALAEKPSGCVVWFVADPSDLSIGPYLWLGARASKGLPVPEGRVARHSRGNAAGIKGERKALRKVPMGRFTRVAQIEELARLMFVRDHDELLREHLAARGLSAASIAIPSDLSWEAAAEFAMLIDGYELATLAGLGDPFAYQACSRSEAEAVGRWSGSALELWVSLFLECRRERFDGALGMGLSPYAPPILDELCRSLSDALGAWQQQT